MQAVGIISRQDFETALATARAVGTSAPLDGLAAPLSGALMGRIAEVWDLVESALQRAFQFGADLAKDSVEAAVRTASDLVESAGNRARDVHQALLAHVQTYLWSLVDSALAQVRAMIVVGTDRLSLESIDMSQTISLTGSLKVAITDIASLTGAGELTVCAHYAIAESPKADGAAAPVS